MQLVSSRLALRFFCSLSTQECEKPGQKSFPREKVRLQVGSDGYEAEALGDLAIATSLKASKWSDRSETLSEYGTKTQDAETTKIYT